MPVVEGEHGDEYCVPIGMTFDLKNASTIPDPAPYDPDIKYIV